MPIPSSQWNRPARSSSRNVLPLRQLKFLLFLLLLLLPEQELWQAEMLLRLLLLLHLPQGNRRSVCDAFSSLVYVNPCTVVPPLVVVVVVVFIVA